METKLIEVCTAIHYDVSCMYNEPVDIKCGGPAVLGYDFSVAADQNIEEVKSFIKKCIRKHNRPFMGISTHIVKDYPVSKLWTRERIEKCIEENYIG